ncbi:MAG TPA: PSD1 and planctomycete cytochrome C domain-containing protein [Candidatus Didemnitutus sp.]|nr:PSD1 and planctomycete cytochrome C domain-containing protein [Candidatus Didemnitutus sp.]
MRARLKASLFGAMALAGAAIAAVATKPVTPVTIPPQRPLSSDDLQFFETKIRPLLVNNCYKCHSRDADKIKGGYLLDTREGMLEGGDDGPSIVPGHPELSHLMEGVRYGDENFQMPTDKRLSDDQIALLEEWIRRGAPDPRSRIVKGSSPTYGGVGKQHWSFLPVNKPAVPVVQDRNWGRSPVDNFVLAKLEQNGLHPNPIADKRTLIRRVTFDLIGLPPTEPEIQRFLADDSPDAFAKVVDRLLASPHYGERWGRYWLDVVRYADTKGEPVKRTDPRFPHAWTYRDYVIDAFNSDKPYNQFIVEQLAADHLVNKSSPDQSALAAMGFLTLGNQFEGNIRDIVNDQIDVTSKAFLGLTVSCARCHDHKFDPIPQKDYYSLYGIFASSTLPKTLPALHPVQDTPEYQEYRKQMIAVESQQSELQLQFRQARRAAGGRLQPDQRKEFLKKETNLQRELGDLENSAGAPARAMELVDSSSPKDYPVLLRGEAQNFGPVVPRRFLEVLSGPQRPNYTKGSGRLELAEAIADPKNPLTARVLVNRIWQQHFGDGIVLTPDDLGNASAPPSDPELLDYLAKRFVEEGWSIKKLHRMILLTSTYQESSAPNPLGAEVDPDNRLLWRANVRRLDFEEIHDSILAIAGALDSTVGGKSVSLGSEGFATRRAMYVYIDRRNPPELLTQFDFPNPNVPVGHRYVSIVPQQSLFLMNSPFVIETARRLVHRPEFLDMKDDALRVNMLYLAIYQRSPTDAETKLCLSYVEANPNGTSTDSPSLNPAVAAQMDRVAKQQAQVAERVAQNAGRKNLPQVEAGGAAFKSRAPLDAWTKLAHALVQANETVFVD